MRVVAPLEQVGHTVEAIDLPGGGDDPTPPGGVTLETCVVHGDRRCEWSDRLATIPRSHPGCSAA